MAARPDSKLLGNEAIPFAPLIDMHVDEQGAPVQADFPIPWKDGSKEALLKALQNVAGMIDAELDTREEHFWEKFCEVDAEMQGSLNAKQLERFLTELSDSLTEEEVDAFKEDILACCGDESVHFVEFLIWWQRHLASDDKANSAIAKISAASALTVVQRRLPFQSEQEKRWEEMSRDDLSQLLCMYRETLLMVVQFHTFMSLESNSTAAQAPKRVERILAGVSKELAKDRRDKEILWTMFTEFDERFDGVLEFKELEQLVRKCANGDKVDQILAKVPKGASPQMSFPGFVEWWDSLSKDDHVESIGAFDIAKHKAEFLFTKTPLEKRLKIATYEAMEVCSRNYAATLVFVIQSRKDREFGSAVMKEADPGGAGYQPRAHTAEQLMQSGVAFTATLEDAMRKSPRSSFNQEKSQPTSSRSGEAESVEDDKPDAKIQLIGTGAKEPELLES